MNRALALAALLLLAAGPVQAGGALTLEQAIAKAYASHPDLVAAEARLAKAKLAIADLETDRYALTARLDAGGGAAASRILPIALAATGSFDNTLVAPATSAFPSAVGSVEFRAPLFDGGKTPEGIRAAGSERSALEADRDAARSALALQVTKAFWALRQAILAMSIERQAEKQAYRAVELARAGKQTGRQTQHDVEQAEAAWWTAQAQTQRALTEVGPAKIAFNVLIGGVSDEFGTEGDPPESPLGPTALPEGDQLEAAIARRPDVRAGRARVTAAEAAVAAAKGDYWPALALSTGYTHGNSLKDARTGKLLPGLGELSGTWDVMLSASYNLFDLGKTGRSVEKAQLDLASARAALEKTERQARAEVQSATYRARFSATRVSMLAMAKTLASRHHDWVLARKEQGLSLAIEVEDARSKLSVAEHQHLNARIDYVLQMAELQAALGEL